MECVNSSLYWSFPYVSNAPPPLNTLSTRPTGTAITPKQNLDFDRPVTSLAPEHKGIFSFSAGDAVGSHFLDSRIFASVLCQVPLQLCPLLLCTHQREDMRNEMRTGNARKRGKEAVHSSIGPQGASSEFQRVSKGCGERGVDILEME